jgi:hypothetical protein
LAGALAIGVVPLSPAHAQDTAPAVVTIAPVGAGGISGLALMSPAAGGTSIQIIVAEAPSETFAVVHGGTCEAIDPTPVALLGDVSDTTQVTVANAFDTLADGGHVLALHAGLDLTSAVGCGAIPALATTPVEPDPTQAPPESGGTFTGPITGFAVTWSPDWERYEVVEVEGQDRVGLRNGSSSMLLAARNAPAGDPQGCVRDARQELFDRLDAGSIRDLAPMTDEQGATISGVETGRAWLTYRYIDIENGEAAITDHLECRQVGDVLLSVLHRSFTDDYARATGVRERLLSDLRFPDGPAPAPSRATGGGSYTAPTAGFALTWDGRWTEFAVEGLERREHIGLSDGPSRVVVLGIVDPTWDALACAYDSDANFQLQANQGDIRDLEPLLNPDGTRIRGGDATRAWIGYRYVHAGTGVAVAEYHECRAANGLVVSIQHRTPAELYEVEAAARDALLTGLTMPSAPPATPAPTPDAACEGYAAWHESTLARVDTLASLRSQETQGAADVLTSNDAGPYRALLRRLVLDVERLRADQEAQAAPAAAADAQALAVEMFTRYGKAAAVLSQYWETSTDLVTLQRAQDAQKAAQEAQRDFETALVAVETVCG